MMNLSNIDEVMEFLENNKAILNLSAIARMSMMPEGTLKACIYSDKDMPDKHIENLIRTVDNLRKG